jgi:hypothetical protein
MSLSNCEPYVSPEAEAKRWLNTVKTSNANEAVAFELPILHVRPGFYSVIITGKDTGLDDRCRFKRELTLTNVAGSAVIDDDENLFVPYPDFKTSDDFEFDLVTSGNKFQVKVTGPATTVGWYVYVERII